MITMEETTGSPQMQVDPPEVERSYMLYGSEDEAEVAAELIARAPATDSTLGIELPLQNITAVTPLTKSVWTARTNYGLKPLRGTFQTGESAYAFDTSGGVTHITQSFNTAQRKAAPGLVAPDYQGAIGVDGEGVQGADIVTPAFAWNERHFMHDGLITPGYIQTLFRLTGTINRFGFKAHAPGSCLFVGAQGGRRGRNADWEIAFNFKSAPGRNNFAIGQITGLDKTGWQYVWVRYMQVLDAVSKMKVERPAAAYVEDVYYSEDFSALNIGT